MFWVLFQEPRTYDRTDSEQDRHLSPNRGIIISMNAVNTMREGKRKDCGAGGREVAVLGKVTREGFAVDKATL